MTFVDSNIPMWLIEATHPHKTEAQLLLERVIAAGQRLVADSAVLEEILHRIPLSIGGRPSEQRSMAFDPF